MTTKTRRAAAIAGELLRINLAAIANDGYEAIVHTAVSPVVTEAKDCSCTILDGEGRLVVGGGQIPIHFWAAVNHVGAVIRTHDRSIADGDVFIGNDPHCDTAIHPQDVMVSRPVFVHGRRVGWIVDAAHVTDVGGMQFGSYAPAATECYQEALRLPPVRVIRQGEEQKDIWSIILNNVRRPDMLEMDVRGMVAGCHLAEAKVSELIEEFGGPDEYQELVDGLIEGSRSALQKRIRDLSPGRYRMTSWTEWDTELYAIPCEMDVDGGKITFDFSGAAAQCEHLFNSKTWIVASKLVTYLWFYIAQDIPLNHGIFESIELHCPPGSVLNSRPPAPISAAHVDACGIAVGAGIFCLSLCLAASDKYEDVRHITGQVTDAGSALTTWQFTGIDGRPDGCVMVDGIGSGSPAGIDRDGVDLLSFIVATNGRMELVDIEVLETWYPLLVSERRASPGGGEGQYRGGAGCMMTFQPYGTDVITGVMLARREMVPFEGLAGGRPGHTTGFAIRREDGTVEQVGGHDVGVRVRSQEQFIFRCNSGGGFGDPVDRDPNLIALEIQAGRNTREDATEIYGVVVDDALRVDTEATERERQKILASRLHAAVAPRVHSVPGTVPGEREAELPMPLYPGVEQRGHRAYATRTGALLAEAPSHWTDGCPTIEERIPTRSGRCVVIESFLDPLTGHALHIDVHLDGQQRSFETLPNRWVGSALQAPSSN